MTYCTVQYTDCGGMPRTRSLRSTDFLASGDPILLQPDERKHEPVSGKRQEHRRNALMKTAAKLFLQHGYEGVTVDAVVKRSGGSKSTVYDLFGGKCGLFLSSMDASCNRINAPLRDLDYSNLTLRESLVKFGSLLVELISRKDNIALYRLVIAESARCPELGEAWYAHGPQATIELIAGILRSHAKQKRAMTVSVERAAVSLHDAWASDLQHRLLSGVGPRIDKESIAASVQQTVHLFLSGWEPRQRRGLAAKANTTPLPNTSRPPARRRGASEI
jgi:AcrR family transcriptional regulator